MQKQAAPSRYILMLKMDGCGHCDITKQNIKTLTDGKRHTVPFYIGTMEEYKKAQQKHKFVNAASNKVISAVTGFPTLFIIENGKIIEQSVGRQTVQDLIRFQPKPLLSSKPKTRAAKNM